MGTLVKVLLLVAVCFIAGAVWRIRQSQMLVAKLREAAKFVTTQDSRKIRVRVKPGDETVILLLGGLYSVVEDWTWLLQSPISATLIAYDRAGLGLSEGPSSPVERDAREILDQVAPGKKVFIMGHSLGGLYAYLVAEEIGTERVHGLMLLDPMTPYDLTELPQQDRHENESVFAWTRRAARWPPYGMSYFSRAIASFGEGLPLAIRQEVVALNQQASHLRASAAEVADIPMSMERVGILAKQGRLASFRVEIVSAGMPLREGTQAFQGLHRRLLGFSHDGMQIFSEASHNELMHKRIAVEEIAVALRRFTAL